jgi:hypothetical protein
MGQAVAVNGFEVLRPARPGRMVAVVLGAALCGGLLAPSPSTASGGGPVAVVMGAAGHEMAAVVGGGVRAAGMAVHAGVGAVASLFERGSRPGRKAGMGLLTAAAVLARANAASATPPDINPGLVSTAAGSGVNATTDGTRAAASFKAMGGMVVVAGYGYVGTSGSVRKVDLSSGQVTTLAGSATATGCVDSADPTLARFAAIRDMATDGTWLYVIDANACNGFQGSVRRVSLATGATSAVADVGLASHLTFGPDGYLYVTIGLTVHQVDRLDPATGVVSVFASTPSGAGAETAIASDATNLWVGAGGSAIFQIPLSTAVATSWVTNTDGAELASDGLVSAGDYLYATAYRGTVLRRYNKVDATWANIAGTGAAGYANGVGANGWFAQVTGIGFDGTNLWLADSGNYRLREAVSAAALPAAQQPSATTTVAINVGAVSTFAGTGTYATVDGTGTAASFKRLGGSVVVGGYDYVGTTGSVRKVNVASGAVSTLAGSAVAGCADNPDPTAASFGTIRDVTTDGTWLYVIDTNACNSFQGAVRRVSLATGATSTVAATPLAFHLTFGPDGMLYLTVGSGIHQIDRLDPATGIVSVFATMPSGTRQTMAITSDATDVWVAGLINTDINGNPSANVYEIVRVALTTGVLATWFTISDTQASLSDGLVSAGGYLYATDYGDTGLRRYDKSDRSWVNIAGSGNAGYAEGVGANASFNQINAIATDGTSLWVSDSDNERLRRVIAGPAGAAMTNAELSGGGNPGEFCLKCFMSKIANAATAKPVDAETGNFWHTFDDLSTPGRGVALDVQRTYNSDPSASALNGPSALWISAAVTRGAAGSYSDPFCTKLTWAPFSWVTVAVATFNDIPYEKPQP